MNTKNVDNHSTQNFPKNSILVFQIGQDGSSELTETKGLFVGFVQSLVISLLWTPVRGKVPTDCGLGKT